MSDVNWLIDFESLDLQKTCRTCLSQSTENRNLFLVEDGIKLANILKSITTIKLAENDNLPPNVCETCADRLMKILAFKQTCEDIDAKLNKYFDTKQRHKTHAFVEDGKTTDLKMEYSQNEVEATNTVVSYLVMGERNYTISKEQFKELSSQNLQIAQTTEGNKFRNELRQSTKKRKTYQCTECSLTFARHYNLVLHKGEHHDESAAKLIKNEDGYIIQLNPQFSHSKIQNYLHIETQDPLGSNSTHSAVLDNSIESKMFPCETCGKIYYSKNGLHRHNRSHTGERPFLCTICDKRFIMNTDLQAHLRLHDGVSPYLCKICGKGFTKKYTLTRHEVTHATEKTVFKCEHCPTVFDNLNMLKEHSLSHEPNNEEEQEKNAEEFGDEGGSVEIHTKYHQCDVCSKIYMHASSLKEHMKNHDDSVQFVCSICGQTFRTEKRLKDHARKLHDVRERQYKCNVCPKTFKQRHRLNTHINVIHTGMRPFTCAVCDMAFKSATQLRKHYRVHSHYRPYKCDICPKSFKTQEAMKYHALSSHTDKPIVFTCKICGKVYSRKGGYQSHIRTHQQNYMEKRHTCHVCGKGFPLGSMLNVHMKIHSEPNVKCPECSKLFRSHIHLKRHMTTHSSEKMAICPICGKAISRFGKLKIHMRTHTGERPYVCDICGKGCTTSTMLKVHVQTHSRSGRKRDISDVGEALQIKEELDEDS